MKYLIKIAYDGSKFYGFQRLKNKETVQKKIEDALTILDRNPVIIKGAGRTDRGVHASGQYAHFELMKDIPEQNLLFALNKMIHPFIHIISIKKVKEDFHARFSVVKKRYIYQIWTGEFSPFKEDYFFQYNRKIDLKKWKECAELFIGAYNFHNFVSGERENYNAIINKIEIKQNHDMIQILFEGKSFYRYMVRNLVGAIIDYGENRCDLELIQKMLEDDKFIYQLRTAPANGLYLDEIEYDVKEFQ